MDDVGKHTKYQMQREPPARFEYFRNDAIALSKLADNN